MANLQSKKQVLDRFLIGEELGRGAYGQVYKGKDTTTGQNVAIKQISLSGASQENLQSVMGELELLKTLNHKNIVKYIGSFKTRTHLYIILEYMEYGALSSIIKPNRFGVFQEPLVAVYITQVLQGLAYLHAQGVVHRDIKGANILTTKEVGSRQQPAAAGASYITMSAGSSCTAVATLHPLSRPCSSQQAVTAVAAGCDRGVGYSWALPRCLQLASSSCSRGGQVWNGGSQEQPCYSSAAAAAVVAAGCLCGRCSPPTAARWPGPPQQQVLHPHPHTHPPHT
jgi:hypothetical protein